MLILHNGEGIAIITQLRKRNFILCLHGADYYGFIHRTFLEYFCASAIVEKFNDHEIDIENLKNDFYGLYWEDQTWHEVLRLICGMKEKVVDDIIQYLMQIYHRKWYGKRPPWNIVLAIKCLSEIRNPGAVDETAKNLLLRTFELFNMVRWTKDFNRFLVDEILPAVKLVSKNWPHRHLVASWISSTYYGYYQFLYYPDYALSNAWAEFTTDLGTKEICLPIKNMLHGSDSLRLLAVLTLGKYQPKSEAIHSILADLAIKDNYYYIRRAAVESLAQGWHDDTDTLPLIKDRAMKDKNDDIRRAAVEFLAQGWQDDPDILLLIKDRAVKDKNEFVRLTAIRSLVEGWQDDPDTLSLIKDRAMKDKDGYVRSQAVESLAQGWHDDTDTLPLIKDLAVNDKNDDVRSQAVESLAQGWHDDTDTLTLIKDRFMNDENAYVRLTAVRSLAQGWHDDVDTLLSIKDWAVNDKNEFVRLTAIRSLVEGWHDDPDTLSLIKDRAVKDKNNYVRREAIESLVQGWYDDPDTLTLIKDLMVNDINKNVRRTAAALLEL